MIRKVVAKYDLHDPGQAGRDLAYWLSRSPEERIEAVELLRRQQHASESRLQRVARVIRRPSR